MTAPRVVIVGAGFGGLAAAIELRRRGFDDVTVLERSAGVGGTARFAGTAWTGCDSWYRDSSGRLVANSPGYMREYEDRVRTLDPSEFDFVPAPDREPVLA